MVYFALLSGGRRGQRQEFLGTADSVSAGVYIDQYTKDHYYSVTYSDPQFLGGRSVLTVEGHVIKGSNYIRTDTIDATGESYKVRSNGFNLTYGTRWRHNTGVTVGYKWDDVRTDKLGDPFAELGTPHSFYYSGRQIPDARIGCLTFDIGSGNSNSFFFPTEGYYLGLHSELAARFTGSSYGFTRSTVTALGYQNIYRQTNVLAGRFMYSYLTGNPPDYELLPFDWQVRGYRGNTHRGKSLMAANFEYRFIANPGIFQGVLFTDFGRAWDGHQFGFKGLEYSYGIGMRIYLPNLFRTIS